MTIDVRGASEMVDVGRCPPRALMARHSSLPHNTVTARDESRPAGLLCPRDRTPRTSSRVPPQAIMLPDDRYQIQTASHFCLTYSSPGAVTLSSLRPRLRFAARASPSPPLTLACCKCYLMSMGSRLQSRRRPSRDWASSYGSAAAIAWGGRCLPSRRPKASAGRAPMPAPRKPDARLLWTLGARRAGLYAPDSVVQTCECPRGECRARFSDCKPGN